MEIGQVSEIVESPYGYHILSRVPIVEYSASHILIPYAGAENVDPDEERTKEEAKKLAEEILAEAKKDGADFAALAKQHSSCPSSQRGGFLGIFSPGQMVEPFEKALAEAKIGEIVGPVETPFGFHIIRRDKVEMIRASHILIQYQGSMRAGPMVTRTKEQAKAAAQEILDETKKDGADFAALAVKHSDDPSAKAKGGDLGFFGRNQMHEAFDKAAFALKPGEIVGPVETPFGFHIIKRTE
ncbi:MAG: peptidyl-prolyl cis-trans isomerase [Planctomycetes bacterium]|nr:peptidyl-prolyl cis-trans isomerase [Planctomycetota bacterium]